MKTTYRTAVILTVAAIALLILGRPWSPTNTLPPIPPSEGESGTVQILTEIQRSLENLEESVKSLAERQVQFDERAENSEEIHKLRAEVSHLRSVQQENVDLRDELLQATEDLFTLSDMNQNLSHQLEEASSPAPGRRQLRDLPAPVRILDHNGSPFVANEALGDSPHQLLLGENGEFIFVNPTEEFDLELGLPGGGTELLTLPASHPTTTAECRSCHTPQELTPKESSRVRLRPRSAPLRTVESRNILKL